MTYNLTVSYLEIYNECVKDLLNPKNKSLDVRESKGGDIFIDKLSECKVDTLDDTLNLLHKGDLSRQIGETKLNDRSSRSHTIFRINIEINERNLLNNITSIRTSLINLVDLAGSEGVSKSKAEGLRLKEG